MLFDGSAQQEAASRKASLAGNGCFLLKRLNTADDCLSLCPKGAVPISQVKAQTAGNGMPFSIPVTQIRLIGAALNSQTI